MSGQAAYAADKLARAQAKLAELDKAWVRAGSGRRRRIIEHRIEALKGRLGAMAAGRVSK